MRFPTLLLTLLLTSLPAAAAAPLPVSATTSLIADFVQNVGGTRVKVNVIVPAGADSHTFQPSTAALRGLSGSRALFANGGGLEPWLPKLKAAAPKVPVTTLTTGLKLRPAPGDDHDHGHDHAESDPHAWWDADLAAGYVRNAQATLTRLDPAGKATYAKNAAAYITKIKAADAAAKKLFATLPAGKRKVVTNHDSLHYLASRYGLTVVGTVLPGLSTEREPSAGEIAALIRTVKATGARVIFTENAANLRLAQTLARETGARVAPPLYTDALGPKGTAGDTFLKALKYNAETMVKALK